MFICVKMTPLPIHVHLYAYDLAVIIYISNSTIHRLTVNASSSVQSHLFCSLALDNSNICPTIITLIKLTFFFLLCYFFLSLC